MGLCRIGSVRRLYTFDYYDFGQIFGISNRNEYSSGTNVRIMRLVSTCIGDHYPTVLYSIPQTFTYYSRMIEIQNLSKSYGAKTVLSDLNLHLEKGKVYGIVGENGAGKTTLFRCIAGMESYDGAIEAAFSPLK